MDTNCVPLSADLNVFLYSYEAEFVRVREKNKSFTGFQLQLNIQVISMTYCYFQSYIDSYIQVNLK